jgi:hypothetical protein
LEYFKESKQREIEDANDLTAMKQKKASERIKSQAKIVQKQAEMSLISSQ